MITRCCLVVCLFICLYLETNNHWMVKQRIDELRNGDDDNHDHDHDKDNGDKLSVKMM